MRTKQSRPAGAPARPISLVENTAWTLAGQGLRIAIRAVYFVVIARALGAEQFGAFVAVTALVSVLAPFATIGTGNLIVKNVSRNRDSFPEAWGNALLVTFGSGLLLTLFVLAISKWIFVAQITWTVIIAVALADLLFARVTDVNGQAFQAVERLGVTARFQVLLSAARLLGAAAVVTLADKTTASIWAVVYLACSILVAAYSTASVSTQLSRARFAISRIKDEIREGAYFCTSQSAQTIYNDIDKTMLGKLASLDAVGIYAAAYRLFDVAFVPVRSLLTAGYAGFFRHGERGLEGSASYGKKLFRWAMTYSVAAGAAMFLFAGFVPRILGPEYASTVEALRWLAPLPILKAIHCFLNDSLAGAGIHRSRTVAQVTIALLNIGLNLWLIPLYSWRGSAWASVASDGALGLLLLVVLKFHIRAGQSIKEYPTEGEAVCSQ